MQWMRKSGMNESWRHWRRNDDERAAVATHRKAQHAWHVASDDGENVAAAAANENFSLVAEDGETLSLGAGCTLWQLRHHPLVASRYPALAAACGTEPGDLGRSGGRFGSFT